MTNHGGPAALRERPVASVILAAGASSRMGEPKALLPIGQTGDCFLTRLVSVMREAGIGEVSVVVDPVATAVVTRARAIAPHVTVLENPEPSRGQLSSLIIAIEALEARDEEPPHALLVAPVDVPLVGAATVRQLLDTWQRTRALIVRPERAGRHGHPVLFAREIFDELCRADPSRGARSVVHAHAGRAVDVAVEEEGPFVDIDTPDDYRRHVLREPDGGP